MPTLAAGNKTAQGARGFTLLELLVVIALIAIATAGASLALRDSADSALDRDAQRLAALLETARPRPVPANAPWSGAHSPRALSSRVCRRPACPANGWPPPRKPVPPPCCWGQSL